MKACVMTYHQGVGFVKNCLEQGRNIYSASGFIEPVATSLRNNIYRWSLSARASQGGLTSLLLFSPISLRSLGGIGWIGEAWSMAGECFGEARGHGGLGECTGMLQ